MCLYFCSVGAPNRVRTFSAHAARRSMVFVSNSSADRIPTAGNLFELVEIAAPAELSAIRQFIEHDDKYPSPVAEMLCKQMDLACSRAADDDDYGDRKL